jgi:hypothetical protein
MRALRVPRVSPQLNTCVSLSSSPLSAVKLASNSVRWIHTYCLGSSAFARHYSRNRADNSSFMIVLQRSCRIRSQQYLLLSFPLATEMFHFTRFPRAYLFYSVRRMTGLPSWVSPFGHPRIKGCLPPPRGLSQAATSFIGFSIPSHPPYALTCLGHPESRQQIVMNLAYEFTNGANRRISKNYFDIRFDSSEIRTIRRYRSACVRLSAYSFL